uniref:Amine oxidase domain-containing protein n=1 Tax=Rhodosorus marinus TaxID=101924 RepID=A0A7S3EAU0_9RHOD|mmetsp:Transcript_21502/g.87722  ORF Transcript_21502/g.87722 Transcript_21502/m.87722 type:complete len:361 (+) Transcript_21502:2364-3446(+)
MSRYLPRMLSSFSSLPFLTRPFSEIMDAEKVDDPLLRNWIDLLCFLLSGLPATGTPTVEAAFMLADFYSEGAVLDYPKGGSGELVDALSRGVTKRGGRIMLGHHVDSVLVENNRATGVRTTAGKVFLSKDLVVSNASCWDTARLLQNDLSDDAFQQWNQSLSDTPECKSFMHLHLGFDSTGLDDLLCHYIHVFDWEKGIDAEGNVVLISIPSVLDPSLAPEGKHVLHAYTPASEPYDQWAGLKRGSQEYLARKQERSGVLWKALEQIVPDIRSRADIEMIGTPLTHEKFLRRSRGSYGPAIRAGQDMFPFSETPVKRLIRCGDSVFPGIGLPAVAAGALIAANSRSSILSHLALLDEIGL